jgi:hypothetical protein
MVILNIIPIQVDFPFRKKIVTIQFSMKAVRKVAYSVKISSFIRKPRKKRLFPIGVFIYLFFSYKGKVVVHLDLN